MNSKNRDLVLMGIAGIALGYYANSNKGRAMRAKMAEDISDQATTLKEKGTEVVGQMKTKGTEVVDQASEAVHHLKDKGNSVLSSATDLMAELRVRGNTFLKSMGQPAVNDPEIEEYINSEIKDFKETLAKNIDTKVKALTKKVNTRVNSKVS